MFQKGYVAYFGPPTHIVCDQDALCRSVKSYMVALPGSATLYKDIKEPPCQPPFLSASVSKGLCCWRHATCMLPQGVMILERVAPSHTHIVCDQDGCYIKILQSFTSSLMHAFTEQLNIKVIFVSPTNHKSLLAEHGIKSLSNLLVKHLTEVWSWPDCLPYAMLCYNCI